MINRAIDHSFFFAKPLVQFCCSKRNVIIMCSMLKNKKILSNYVLYETIKEGDKTDAITKVFW